MVARVVKKKKSPKNYADNVKFLEVIIKYLEDVKLARANETELPQIPEFIGKCLFDIGTNFAKRPNFFGYSYRDEMISDGIENSIRYIENFDPKKSSNPFSYFTQIMFYAFLRRIEREKKQSYIRHNLTQNLLTELALSDSLEFDDILNHNVSDIDVDKIEKLIKQFDTKKNRSDDASYDEENVGLPVRHINIEDYKEED